MIPDNSEELRVLAGEYVLGVLDAHEADEVAAALAVNAELRRAVVFWERRLHPLSSLAISAEPPTGTGRPSRSRSEPNGKAGCQELLDQLGVVALVDRGICRRCRGTSPLDRCYARSKTEPCRHPSPPAAGSGQLDSNCRSLRLGLACGYQCGATERPGLRAVGHCPWGDATAIARRHLPEWRAEAVSTTG